MYVRHHHHIIALPSMLPSTGVEDPSALALPPLSACQQCLSFAMSDPFGQHLCIITGIMDQMPYNILLVPH